MRNKLVRVTTIPLSLEKLLDGQLSHMNQSYDVIAVSSDEAKLKALAEKESISYYCVNMTRKITPFSDLVAIWKLYKFLLHTQPLIIHSHTPKAGMISMIAAKLARVPIRLHTVAGLPFLESSGVRRYILILVEKITYACSTMVYPNSFGLTDILLNLRITKHNKLKVLANGSSNGIDVTDFCRSSYTLDRLIAERRKLNIQIGDFVLIFVGRLVKDKGLNELVTAFKRLQSEHLKLKLLLVGPFEDDLDPLSSTTKLEISKNPNIINVGYQHDVRPFMAIANALVFPSYREGFPNVVMQAGAMGLPSIVSDINGCNEIIVDGENGIIIPPKDVNALYNAIEKFITEKDLLKRLSSNARKMIVERYEQQVVWDAILAEYKRLEKDVQKRN